MECWGLDYGLGNVMSPGYHPKHHIFPSRTNAPTAVTHTLHFGLWWNLAHLVVMEGLVFSPKIRDVDNPDLLVGACRVTHEERRDRIVPHRLRTRVRKLHRHDPLAAPPVFRAAPAGAVIAAVTVGMHPPLVAKEVAGVVLGPAREGRN